MTNPQDDDRAMIEQLAATGRVAVLETRGRVSLMPIRTAIGFIREPDGSLLVAAGDPDADWAKNLVALPACAVRIGDEGWFAHAEPIDGAERAHAIAELIVKYGTPAERLGGGPAFRLRPDPIATSRDE
jgi:deazaflavin-dependent oxidoreductase (nitroreductase family)